MTRSSSHAPPRAAFVSKQIGSWTESEYYGWCCTSLDTKWWRVIITLLLLDERASDPRRKRRELVREIPVPCRRCGAQKLWGIKAFNLYYKYMNNAQILSGIMLVRPKQIREESPAARTCFTSSKRKWELFGMDHNAAESIQAENMVGRIIKVDGL